MAKYTRSAAVGSEDPLERRKWQPAPVFLPGKSHGQRSLADYSPWGREDDAVGSLDLLCLLGKRTGLWEG